MIVRKIQPVSFVKSAFRMETIPIIEWSYSKVVLDVVIVGTRMLGFNQVSA
jgi:hypothetical protein